MSDTDQANLKRCLEALGCERVRLIPSGTMFKVAAFVAFAVPEWMEPLCGVTGEGYSLPDLLNDRNAMAEVLEGLDEHSRGVFGRQLLRILESKWKPAVYPSPYQVATATPAQQLQAWAKVNGVEWG